MRYLVSILTGLMITGCASGPFEMSGQYRAKIDSDCSLTIESKTIKGGPNLVLERTPDGCKVSVEHDQRAELIPLLERVLRP